MGIIALATQKPEPLSLEVLSSGGYIYTTGTWDQARNTGGNAIANTVDTEKDDAISSLYIANYRMWRSFLYFDLSTLPVGATIVSAVVDVRGYLDANSQVCIQQGTQTGTDNSGLIAGDWNAFTGIYFSVVDWALTANPRNNFELDAAGMAYVLSVAGSIAKFCLREYASDYSDVEPTDGASSNGMYFGAGNTPSITIEYRV